MQNTHSYVQMCTVIVLNLIQCNDMQLVHLFKYLQTSVWVLHTLVESLLFIRLAVADQPDCHVFEERHERRVLSLRLFWICVLGNDIAVVDTGGEEVEEDSSPPLL